MTELKTNDAAQSVTAPVKTQENNNSKLTKSQMNSNFENPEPWPEHQRNMENQRPANLNIQAHNQAGLQRPFL